MNIKQTFQLLNHYTFDTVCELTLCSTAALKMCYIAYAGLIVSVKNRYPSSPARQIFKEYFSTNKTFVKRKVLSIEIVLSMCMLPGYDACM